MRYVRLRGMLLPVVVRVIFVCAVAPAAGGEGASKEVDPWSEYVLKQKWNEGRTHYADAIIAACDTTKKPSSKRLKALYFGYLVCKFFPEIQRLPGAASEKRKFVTWLLEEKKLVSGLLLMLTAEDHPARAFEIVYVIWKRSKSDTRRYRNLTIAFAVVWDGYGPDNKLLRTAFSWFDKKASKLRMSVRKPPPVVLKYVVDSQRPVAERQWAMKRYPGVTDVGKLYEKPKYDEDAFSEGRAKKISGHEYTLQNILKYGGVCHDRAVFATEVGKTLAVPCAYIRGGSSSGYGHAWVGYLKRRGKGYKWDRDSGRIGAEEITGGEIYEPQSLAWVSEHELELASRAMALSADKRAEARMWLGVARLLAEAEGGGEQTKKAAVRAIEQSTRCGVFDKAQWHAYAELAKKKALSAEEVKDAINEFSKTLKKHPPLVVDAFEVLLSALGKDNAKEILKQCDRMIKRFPRNDIVVARVQLLKGKHFEALNRNRAAEKVYAKAAVKAMKCRRYGLELLDNAARLMLERKDRAAAIALHKRAFARAPKFGDDAYMIFSSRFRVGLRSAKLYQIGRSRRDRAKHDRMLKDLLRQYRSGGSKRRKALFEYFSAMTYVEINQTSRPVTD